MARFAPTVRAFGFIVIAKLITLEPGSQPLDLPVCVPDIIPNLARAIELSRSIRYAYLCHPCVQHVSKLRREGENGALSPIPARHSSLPIVLTLACRRVLWI